MRGERDWRSGGWGRGTLIALPVISEDEDRDAISMLSVRRGRQRRVGRRRIKEEGIGLGSQKEGVGTAGMASDVGFVRIRPCAYAWAS